MEELIQYLLSQSFYKADDYTYSRQLMNRNLYQVIIDPENGLAMCQCFDKIGKPIMVGNYLHPSDVLRGLKEMISIYPLS